MSEPNNIECIIINSVSFNDQMFHKALKAEADKFIKNLEFQEEVKVKHKRIKKLNKIKYNYSKRKR